MDDLRVVSARSEDMVYRELRQVSVREDGELDAVNEYLAGGWRLVDIGYRADATIYVLGRYEERAKHRAGFLSSE